MITPRTRDLLRAADPWGVSGCKCGLTGAPVLPRHERALSGLYGIGDDLLEATGVTDVGEGAEGTVKAIQAGDFNGVVEGGKKTMAAAEGVYTGLKSAWSGAEKFFMSMGGNVAVPAFGYKQRVGPNTVPMILFADDMPGYQETGGIFGTPSGYSKGKYPIQWANVDKVNVYNAKQFMRQVANGYTFVQEAWQRFGLKEPIPPPTPALLDLFMKQGLAWNPFKSQWQGQTPGQTITPQSPVPKSPTGQTLTAEQAKVNDQAWVNAMGATATGFEMQLRWVRDEYRAGRWKKAINGTPLGSTKVLKMGANGLIGILGKPFPWVVRAIAEGMTFTEGPLAGQSFKAARVTWIRQLARLLKAQPQSRRPANIGFLVTATDTGLSEGRPILGADTLTNGKPGAGAAVAIGAGLGLGLLWMFFA